MMCRSKLILETTVRVTIIVAIFSGCDGNTTDDTSSQEVTAESLNLGPDVEEMGPDPKGRYWFKLPVQGTDGKRIPGKHQTRVYDPKTKTLYSTIKQADGKIIMTEIQEVTAESLGLGAGAKRVGKDPLGRYWFELAGKSERRVYNPATKKLFAAVKQADGQWKLTEIVSSEDKNTD